MPPEIDDLNDYQIPEWPSTPEGEERQAKEAALHYKTLFSNPNVESITWWDFVDGTWLGAPAGFVTKDNRVKPIYNEIHGLIKNEWWSKPVTAVTNNNGTVSITGYLGDYELTCRGKKISFTIDKINDVVTLVV
jgi:hypothetical protein